MGRPFASPDLPSSNCTHLSSSPAPPIHTTVLNSQPCRYLSFSACFPPAPHNQPSILILFFFVPCQVLLISNLFHGYLPLYTSCLRPPGPWTLTYAISLTDLFAFCMYCLRKLSFSTNQGFHACGRSRPA